MDKVNEEEPFKTFGDFTERWWTVYALWAELIIGLFQDLMKVLKRIFEEPDPPHPLDAR